MDPKQKVENQLENLVHDFDILRHVESCYELTYLPNSEHFEKPEEPQALRSKEAGAKDAGDVRVESGTTQVILGDELTFSDL
jgi:hypothetical protein